MHHSPCHIVFYIGYYNKTHKSRLKYEIKYDLENIGFSKQFSIFVQKM